jgi:heptosyltransferase-2
MILKTDCRHFPGDRPCVYNKRDGLLCDACPHYAVATARILIVKLDAVGDVLRTTCVLHGLHEAHPGCEVVWVTRRSALPLFEQNPLVHRVLAYESTEAVLHATTESFDLVINLDAARESAVLASAAKAPEKIGYGVDARGHVVPFNAAAELWLEMGAFDQVKKKNTRSFQDLMLEMCGLRTRKKEIVLRLSDAERAFAESFAKKKRINRKRPVIGMNTGASDRWQYKQWTLEGYQGLVRMLLKRTDATILLYGGPSERKRNEKLRRLHARRVIDTGTDNSLREFFALMTLSDVFLTGDTLALHAATALGKKVVAYFGPTSAAEIDSYDGQVTKVQSALDCLVCYKPRCDFEPNCMNSISVEQMFETIKARLKK